MEDAISKGKIFPHYSPVSVKIRLCLLTITLVHFSNPEPAFSEITSGLLSAKSKENGHLMRLCHLKRLTTPSS